MSEILVISVSNIMCKAMKIPLDDDCNTFGIISFLNENVYD